MLLHSGITFLISPFPIKLLTRELPVDAKALTKINNRAEVFRTMLVMARERSPRCSIAMKKTNHEPVDIND